MTSGFDRIEHLFHEMLDVPLTERQSVLESLESDPGIVSAVLRLLKNDEDAGTDPVADRLDAIARIHWPQSIGGYRLIRELGAGGMGTVFLAERDVDGRPQQVALKLLHGFPTEELRRRMARERAMLAGLNHSNIARLMDGGISETGQPYLVMDYIDCVALPEYLAAADPGLDARLHLFLGVCAAVQHAHQRLVLHRDIKPSNVVVRQDGTPVLLDFGVGLLMEEDNRPSHTVVPAYTPGYSAPEQIEQRDATTLTDVYGLGALLFDLLSRERRSQILRNHAKVPAPSDVAGSAALRRRLKGDLDRIVAKATRTDPEMRYGSVAALMDDVQRHLQGKPISAAPQSATYRIGKFIRRHRRPVAAAAVVFTGVLFSAQRLNVERQRAIAAEHVSEREATHARASRDFLASVLAETSPEAVRGQPITLSDLLSNAAKRLERDRTQDPQARAIAWLTIAEVYSDINNPNPALDAADRASAILAKQTSPDMELQTRVLRIRGVSYQQLERFDDAERLLRQVVGLREKLDCGPAALARARNEYGSALLSRSDFASAEAQHRHALKLLDDAGLPDPKLRTSILLDLARSLYHQNRVADAAQYLDAAERSGKSIVDANDQSSYRFHRTALLIRHAQDRYQDAVLHSERATAISYRVYGETSRLTADMELFHGMLLDDIGQSADSIGHFTRSLSISRRIGLDDAIIAHGNLRLAMAYANLERHEEAIALIDSALARLPKRPVYLSLHVKAHYTRALSVSATRGYDAARPDFARALTLARDVPKKALAGPEFVHLRAAIAAVRAGRFTEAEHEAKAAEPVVLQGDLDPKSLLAFKHVQSVLALERGDTASAREHILPALALARKLHAPGTAPIAEIELTSARIFHALGDHTRAAPLAMHAASILDASLPEATPSRREAQALLRELRIGIGVHAGKAW